MESDHASALAIGSIGKKVLLEYSVIVGDGRTHYMRAAFLGFGNNVYQGGD
jgi:hypothetical protein